MQQKTHNALTMPLDRSAGRQARRLRPGPAARLAGRACVPAFGGTTHSTGRSRHGAPRDHHRVPPGRRRRREGRHSPVAPQRRDQVAARVGPVADDLGRTRPHKPGIDGPVLERRSGAPARLCPRRPRRRAVKHRDGGTREHGHGFTSAFAPHLEAYLAFKAQMGFYGASRVWYLKQFDAYCTAHGRTVFDRETVEGWVSQRLGCSGPYRSWMSYIRDVGRWLQAHGQRDAYVLSDRWKALRLPPPLPAQPRGDRGVLHRRGELEGGARRGGGRRSRSSR